MGGHHAHHGHGHHGHGPALACRDPVTSAENRRRLLITLLLTVGYMILELTGGYLAGSLALLADAGHMLSDAASLALSFFALWIAQRPATAARTFGYHRMEILAALFNGASLIAISLLIFKEAWDRLQAPPAAVEGTTVALVALGGLLVNLVGLALLNRGRESSLNVQGAWLHLLSDCLGSVGALVAGVLVHTRGWLWADPVASILIGVLVILSSVSLLRESVTVLMEAVPGHIDVDEVQRHLHQVDGIREVHDLHVWTITSGFHCLSAHVVSDGARLPHDLLVDVRSSMLQDFSIRHVTIQIEPEGSKDSLRCAEDHD